MRYPVHPQNSYPKFTSQGFSLFSPDGSHIEYSVNLDVPGISWPVAAAYDHDREIIYGISLGGEGYVYAYDIYKDQWHVLLSMNNHDAFDITYDKFKNRLIILTPGFSGKFVYTIDLSIEATLSPKEVSSNSLKGYTDLYDVGNGPKPPLNIIATENNLLLVSTKPKWHGSTGRNIYRAPSNGDFRTYMLNIETGKVDLVGYGTE